MFVGTGSYRLSKKRAVGSRDVLEYRIKSVLFLLKAKFYKKNYDFKSPCCLRYRYCVSYIIIYFTYWIEHPYLHILYNTYCTCMTVYTVQCTTSGCRYDHVRRRRRSDSGQNGDRRRQRILCRVPGPNCGARSQHHRDPGGLPGRATHAHTRHTLDQEEDLRQRSDRFPLG